jgi:tetratricopeptide (TPR) repeat protein
MVVEVALIVMGALVGTEMLVFLFLPKQVVRGFGPARRSTAIRVLETLSRLPPVLTPNVKIALYYHLMVLYLQEKRDQDCIRTCRLLLTLRLPQSLRADCTRRLADCLDRAGQLEEASALRRGVLTDGATDGPATSVQLLAQAQMLQKEQQYEQAWPLLERGLAALAPNDHARRVQFMTALMTCAFHRSMIPETAKWAEEALREVELSGLDKAAVRLACHRMAGIAYAILGRLDDAEQQYRLHLEVAEQAGGTAVSDSITALAGLALKRGWARECIELCERAIALNPLRTTYMMMSDAHRYLGEFERALRDLEQARQAGAQPDQRREQYALALLDLNECWIHCWAEQPEAGRVALNRCKPLLSQQEKLRLYVEATDLWLGALSQHTRHLEEDARDLARRAGTERFANDNAVQGNVEQMLGRALFAGGAHEEAIKRWQRFLELETTLGLAPLAWWHISKSLAALGREDEAHQAMRNAASIKSDVYFARLAQEHIRAWEASHERED